MKLTINRCRIIYEAWQMLCCGTPLTVGRKAKISVTDYKEGISNIDDAEFDFFEEHHHGNTLELTGIVESTTTVFVEEWDHMPNSKLLKARRFRYVDNKYIDGHAECEESQLNPSDVYCYHITLRDVDVALPDSALSDYFDFIIDNLSFGTNEFTMDFGGFRFVSNATYLGTEPLSSLIIAIHEMLDSSDVNESYYLDWAQEPGHIGLEFHYDKFSDDLEILLTPKVEKTEEVRTIFHFKLRMSVFRTGVIKAAFMALDKYGILGFDKNWLESNTFPISSLIHILGISKPVLQEGDSFSTNVVEELLQLSLKLKQKDHETSIGD